MSEISNTGYWNGQNAHTHHVFSEPLAKWLCEYLKNDKNKPLYDFGCGLGNYLQHLYNDGFLNLTGFEGDPARLKVFDNILKQDLTLPFTTPVKGNCMFLEVAEHIPAQFEKQALTNVINSCDGKLIMSWAIRGQAGFGHVNCLDNHEVILKMQQYGFTYLENDSNNARSIDLDNAPWFKNTILIFNK
jgi:hypothetical protein